ncbi:MAG: hypothetical protein C6W57_09420 [Caldibacillus debilis]|nr:MAG: hypothetical protein C6W57_09420 [Caldibacillus debilis]
MKFLLTSKQKPAHASGPDLFCGKKNDGRFIFLRSGGSDRGNPPERIPRLFSPYLPMQSESSWREWKGKGECVLFGNRSLHFCSHFGAIGALQ